MKRNFISRIITVRIFLIAFLSTLGNSVYSQINQFSSTCTTAATLQNMLPVDFDTARYEASSTEFWMKFTATDQSFQLTVSEDLPDAAHLHHVYLYSGNCNSLVLQNQMALFTDSVFVDTNLIVGQEYFLMIERGDTLSCTKSGCQYGERYFLFNFQMPLSTISCMSATISGGIWPDQTVPIVSFDSQTGFIVGGFFNVWDCQTICFNNCFQNNSTASVFAIYDLFITGPGGFSISNAQLAANNYCIASGLAPGLYSMDIYDHSNGAFLGSITFNVYSSNHPVITIGLSDNTLCDLSELPGNILLTNAQYYYTLGYSIDGNIVNLNNLPNLPEGTHTLCVDALDACIDNADQDCVTFTIGMDPQFTAVVNCNDVTVTNTSDCFSYVQDWNWIYDDGFTFNGPNPPSHIFANPGNHTIILNVLSPGGNTYSYSLTVSTYSSPTGSISGNTTMCALSGNQYVLTGVVPGTVNWTISPALAGSVFYPPNGTTATVNWVSANGSAIITAQGTDVNGCSYSVNFSVSSCCLPIASLPSGALYTNPAVPDLISNYNGTWPLTFPSPNAQLDHIDVYVYNDLIIDENFRFTDCTLFVAPGKRIIVNNGFSFSMDKVIVYPMCNEMWDGIYAQTVITSIFAQTSEFHQGINALVSENGAKIEAISCKFLNDHIGISVRNYNSAPIGFKVIGSLFETNAPLMPPYNGTQMSKGIEISDINTILVGERDNLVLNNKLNTFHTMDYGVHVTNSGASIYNCNFNNIVPVPNTPPCIKCGCPKGTAVCGTRTAFSTSPMNITVGDTDLPNFRKFNRFLNSRYGVYLGGQYNSMIQYNFFNTVLNSVEIHDVKTLTVNIHDNQFTFFGIANGIYNIPGCSLLVQNNDYLSGTGNIPVVSSTAIYVNHVFSTAFNAEITNNIIDRTRNGIYLINADGYNIGGFPNININTNNQITFTHLSSNNFSGLIHYGIRLENCIGVNASNNTIVKPGVNPNSTTVGHLRGIALVNSQNCYIYENDMMRMGEGIYTYGNCSSSALLCNTIRRTFHGVKFTGPSGTSDVDEQFTNTTPTGNMWLNTPPGGAGLAGGISPTIHWWYSGGGVFLPSVSLLQGSTFGLFGTQPEFTTHSGLCGSLPLLLSPVQEREARIGKIVRGEKVFANNTINFELLDERIAYKLLLKDTSWMNLGTPDDTTYQQFFNERSAGYPGSLETIRAFVSNGNYQDAFSVNDTLNAQNNYEFYQKRVNEIFLYSMINDLPLSAADTSELTFIANQNSTLDGPGVSFARAYLRLEVEDYSNGNQRIMEENVVDEKQNKCSVYPNPNNGTFYLEYDLEEYDDVVLLISDVTGRVVEASNLNLLGTRIEINSKQAPGVYFLNLVADQEIIFSSKLILTE